MTNEVQALAGATGSARHRCARIRRGLYNYRAYNVSHYARGWAVRGEDDKPFGPFAKRLRDICGIIDLWEKTSYPAPTPAAQTIGCGYEP